MPATEVDLYVDPACPWCWLTALWLFEVEALRPMTVTTGLLSLAEVNRAKDARRDSHGAGERALRVLVAARRAGAQVALRAVYTELGEAHHERGEPLGDLATLRGALGRAGLDAGLADEALADQGTLTELLEEHAAAVERGAFGVPSLSVAGGPCFFGPIIDTRIGGAEAARFWDAVAPALAEPRLLELKRHRSRRAGVGRRRQQTAAS